MSLSTKFENSITNSNESKHYNMQQFIRAMRDYRTTRTEETANLINRHLQLLSFTIDLSIFDPHSSIVSEFFASLHELINLEPRSSLHWCCVNVLSTSCRNSLARNALIHIYQFIPPLSRLLGDQVPTEKKIRLLTLMQELTCGIKISWQIPHLKHLMSTLTKWVKNYATQDANIVALSLGVLVNLCYKNLPAVYTLATCVDIKSFVRTTSALEGIEIQVHACKLLIILDHVHGQVPLQSLIKLTEVTFKSIIEAFKSWNSILLRHIIEFFLDIKMQDGRENFIMHYENYDTDVGKLLDTMENNTMCAGDAGNQDSECVSLVLLFLRYLIELKLSKSIPFYKRLVQISLSWLQVENVSTQALLMLHTISIQDVGVHILELTPNINISLSLLVIELEHKSEGVLTNSEYNKKLSALMQLLFSLLKVDSLHEKTLNILQIDHLKKIFTPLLGDKSQSQRPNDIDTSSPEAINLYVRSLGLIYEMSKYRENWKEMYSSLIANRQMHMVLAQGFYSGNKSVKSLILGLALSPEFPRDSVAAAMIERQPVIQMEVKREINHQADNFCMSNISVAQSEKLEQLLDKLGNAIAQNSLPSLATSEVMELYEYKLASLGHAERAAVSSVEAASKACTHLQHRIAQLTSEVSRTHQLLFHSQQCQGDLTKDRDSLVDRNKELTNRLDAEKGKSKALASQLSIKEKTLQEKEFHLEGTCKRLKEVESAKIYLDEENANLKSLAYKLEVNLGKLEKTYKNKEELLITSNTSLEHTKSQVIHLEKQLLQTEAQLSCKKEQLTDAIRELVEKKQILESITKLTARTT